MAKDLRREQTKLRLPPQSIESEVAVLGAVLLKPGSLADIVDIITAQAFYIYKHQIIFSAMLDLWSKNEPVDQVSLTHYLEEKNLLEQVGGRSYIAELAHAVPSAANIAHYAEIVAKKHTLRSLSNVADRINALAITENDDEIDEILDAAEKHLFAVTETPKTNKIISLKDTLGEVWEHIERLHENKGELRGVPTGFHDLDSKLSGLQNSDLIILAARPSVGKTTLALDIARNAATKHDIPVCIFSLEMSAQQLTSRLLAAESRVDAWKLRTGNLTSENDFSALAQSLDRLAKAKIFIDETASNSIVKMRSFARRLKHEHNLGLIIVDYLQLMSTSKNYDSMVNQVTEISRSLKALARELNVPVLALSQLSRAVESRGGRPRLSDLRDSGSIEQDADVVMFIHREDRYKEKDERTNIAQILIEKHRNGPTGEVDLYFDEKYSSFSSIAKGNFEEIAPKKENNEDRNKADLF